MALYRFSYLPPQLGSTSKSFFLAVNSLFLFLKNCSGYTAIKKIFIILSNISCSWNWRRVIKYDKYVCFQQESRSFILKLLPALFLEYLTKCRFSVKFIELVQILSMTLCQCSEFLNRFYLFSFFFFSLCAYRVLQLALLHFSPFPL